MRIVDTDRRGGRVTTQNISKPVQPNSVEDEIGKLLERFELDGGDQEYSERDIAIVCLIADTGLYPVDIRLLRWKHIFPHISKRSITDINELHVPSSFSAPFHGKHSVKDSTRAVIIGPITQARLQDLLRPGTKLTDLVFKAHRVRSGAKPQGSMNEHSITNIWNMVKRDLAHGLTMHKIREAKSLGYVRDLEG